MFLLKNKYINLIVLHILIGVLIFTIPFLAKIYSLLILIIGVLFVIFTKNKNNQVLLVAAYIVGSEAFLRMTSGAISYEFAKYGVIVFLILGIYYSGFSKNAIPFWIYIILLVPGIIIATDTLNYSTNIRTTIAFNVSGPFCLGIASIYCYQRKISLGTLNNVFLYCGLPIISTITYLMLYTPDLSDVFVNTSSNFSTSGGFGPNQVATILGLGMFVFFTRILIESKNNYLFLINVIIFLMIAYRGLITFSRGGIITGIIMIVILIGIIYLNTKKPSRLKISMLLGFISFLLISVWLYTSTITGGLIDKRYANQDASGRVKGSQLSGREEILEDEWTIFMQNPFFGVGVAKGVEAREKLTGKLILSHNEITRTLSEHGFLGIIALLIVFITPMILYIDNQQNIYVFCCIAFWLLTINHAAMRMAAPAFIYSLSLLKVHIIDNTTLHRE